MTSLKAKLEIKRAMLHVFFNIVAFVLIALMRVPDQDIDQMLIGMMIAVIVMEVFLFTGYHLSNHHPRVLYSHAYLWFDAQVARWFVRKTERGKPTAMLSYLTGIVVMRLLLGTPMIECLYIMTILSWGDPAARMGGVAFGRRTLPFRKKKTYAGLLSFVLVSSVMLFLVNVGLAAAGLLTWGTVPIAAQYVAVVAGAITEAYVPVWDNCFITLGALGAYQLMVLV